jgi:hypothetical protein
MASAPDRRRLGVLLRREQDVRRSSSPPRARGSTSRGRRRAARSCAGRRRCRAAAEPGRTPTAPGCLDDRLAVFGCVIETSFRMRPAGILEMSNSPDDEPMPGSAGKRSPPHGVRAPHLESDEHARFRKELWWRRQRGRKGGEARPHAARPDVALQALALCDESRARLGVDVERPGLALDDLGFPITTSSTPFEAGRSNMVSSRMPP